MRTSTAYNHLTRLKSRLSSIYSAAKFYHPTHEKLLEDLKPVFADPALKKCPGWVRQALNDLSSFCFDEIQHKHLVWMFETPRGIMSYEFLTREERDVVNRQDRPGNHYWVKEVTPCVGTIANPGNYKAGDTFVRTFQVTDKKW